MVEFTARLRPGEWPWTAGGERHRILMAAIDARPESGSVEHLMAYNKLQYEQWLQYLGAATDDYCVVGPEAANQDDE